MICINRKQPQVLPLTVFRSLPCCAERHTCVCWQKQMENISARLKHPTQSLMTAIQRRLVIGTCTKSHFVTMKPVRCWKTSTKLTWTVRNIMINLKCFTNVSMRCVCLVLKKCAVGVFPAVMCPLTSQTKRTLLPHS